MDVLEANGSEVDSVNLALQAFKLAQCRYYDLFVFDVRMPKILGTELSEALTEQSPELELY